MLWLSGSYLAAGSAHLVGMINSKGVHQANGIPGHLLNGNRGRADRSDRSPACTRARERRLRAPGSDRRQGLTGLPGREGGPVDDELADIIFSLFIIHIAARTHEFRNHFH